MSSAKSFGFEDRYIYKSIYININQGQQWTQDRALGTWIFFQLDVYPLRTTLCFLFLRKSSRVFSKFPDIPYCFNLKARPLCYTLSKAFGISSFITFIHRVIYLMNYWQQLINTRVTWLEARLSWRNEVILV